jgi:hypothetical protein
MSRTHLAGFVALASLVVLVSFATSHADVDVDGSSYRVVDMHLHPGDFGRFPAGGRTFVIESLPPFVRPYAPALGNAGIDPWAEHIGIRAQTEMAGVERAVLYAVYAPRSTGWYTNRELEAVLTDPRNRNADGSPWAYGMASLSFEGYLEEGVAERRLDALRSYFTAHPGLFVGIKLAHPHQHVALDDGRYLGVFDVAAEVGVPVLLHTGFSPFPGTRIERDYYDPARLASVVEAYDGTRGAGRVDFVLSHVGQGDARAVAAALDLAERYDNVWLEVSALGNPIAIDALGMPTTGGSPQLPDVMQQIKTRGLTARALFASDGPQFSGKVRSYLNDVIEATQAADWSSDELRGLLAENFERLYLE